MGKSKDNGMASHKKHPSKKQNLPGNNHSIHSAYYYAFILAFLVFAGEALIMVGLLFLPIGSVPQRWLLDPLLLTILLLPAFYFFLYRPLYLHAQSRERYEKRLNHLILVLRAIRNVNQLITREKDRDRLLKDSCVILTETRGYYNAWIALFDHAGECHVTAENGLGEKILPLQRMLAQENPPACVRKAMEQKGPVVIKDPPSDCPGCPLSETYRGRSAMTMRLEHGGKIYGLITVSMCRKFLGEEEEKSLFHEVAGDLAFALYNLDLEREQKRSHELLKESEEKFRAAFHGSHDAITLTTKEGKVIDCNHRALEIFGLESIDDFQQKRPADFSPPFQPDGRSSREASREIIDNVLRDGGFSMHEWLHQRKDGTIFPTEIIFTTIRLGGRKILHASIRDITERKQAEEERLRAFTFMQTVINGFPDALMVINRDHTIALANRTAREMVEEDPVAACLKCYQVSHKSEMQCESIEHPCPLPQVIETGAPVTVQHIHYDAKGHEVAVEVSAAPIFDEHGEIVQIIESHRDISARKRAETQVQMLREAIEQAGEMIVITDPEGTIQYVNPAFERITGYHREEVLGQNPRILKSGEQDEAFYRNLWETITSRKTWQGRMVNKRKDGTLYTEAVTISPVCDASGTVINFVGVKRDMTEQLQSEEELRQAQKMEAIGTLAGGIAHDFNNILGAIIGMSELALLEVEERSSLHRHISQVLKASDRAKNLVKQILAFSRQREKENIILSIKPVIKEALKLLRSSIPTSIEIKSYIETDPGLIKGDPTQIHQVLMNLCANAEHAMRETGGILEVQLRKMELGPGDKELKRNADLHEGSYVCLSVSDTGGGIPPEIMDRIFDPYFTTKRMGEGTGLGLAVVQGIVRKHRGIMTVESEPQKGTIFRIYFPRVKGEEGGIRVRSEEILPTGTEQILFIDDEEILTEVGKNILEQLGYDVTIRTSSLEALELFKAKPGHFDLVITDMSMPNMTGAELSRELMKIRPDIPIILCTGFSHTISEKKAQEIGIRAFAMKPLVRKDLAQTVRRVLDG